MRPNAHETVIARQNLRTLPQLLAKSLCLVRMNKNLTVKPAFQTRELKTQCPEHVAVGTFNHLKLLETLLQILGRQILSLPQRDQLRQIFDRCSAYLQIRRSHPGGIIASPLCR